MRPTGTPAQSQRPAFAVRRPGDLGVAPDGSGGPKPSGRQGTPIGPADPGALVAALGAYLDRTLGAAGAGSASVIARRPRIPPAEAGVAVCAGEPSPRWLERVARRTGLRPSLRGRAGRGPAASVAVTLLDRWDPSTLEATPAEFDVLAVMATFNESDIVEDVLDTLREDQVRVHVIDNWSTDGTHEALVRRAAADPGLTVERFPAGGSSGTFELEAILSRVEQVAHSSGADWVVNQDADEIRQSPWPGVSLRRALFALDRFGFNCADFTVMNFRPVADTWDGSRSLAESFSWFEFGAGVQADFVQRKAWKPQPIPVRFAATGGHDTSFAGRRIFPYKFLNRHYPIRSSAHGRRKVLRERQGRWSAAERERGWHVHYDGFSDASEFLWRPDHLHRFDSLPALDERLLIERLTGAGLPANPFAGEALGG